MSAKNDKENERTKVLGIRVPEHLYELYRILPENAKEIVRQRIITDLQTMLTTDISATLKKDIQQTLLFIANYSNYKTKNKAKALLQTFQEDPKAVYEYFTEFLKVENPPVGLRSLIQNILLLLEQYFANKK